MRGLSLVAVSGRYSSLRCAGFSLQWLLLLRSTGSMCEGFSSCGSRALECRVSSCGARAWLLRGMWDLPGPGLEPVSLAFAGGFLTTAPPGKSSCFIFSQRQFLGDRPTAPFKSSLEQQRKRHTHPAQGSRSEINCLFSLSWKTYQNT